MTAFRHRDGRLWLPAVGGAARLRNLRREPAASVLVAEGSGDEHVMVLVEGEARVHEDAAPILDRWLRAAWEDAYGTALDWVGAIIEVVPVKVLSYSEVPPS